MNMGKRSILHADIYGAMDSTKQTIKDCLVQEDLKQLINMNECLIGAANEETVKGVKDKLACTSGLVK